MNSSFIALSWDMYLLITNLVDKNQQNKLLSLVHSYFIGVLKIKLILSLQPSEKAIETLINLIKIIFSYDNYVFIC